jgi:hypothetical protein
VIWLPGLAVAVGAAIATAHGLYEVAHAARVPAGIAWLYPLITDGLALVAYTATARLSGSAARYAWSVVVLAAGLSGLAQAAFLASDSAVDASPALRFGVGAWPAVAAAIVAHLLFLLATDHAGSDAGSPEQPRDVQPSPSPVVQPVTTRPVSPSTPASVNSGPTPTPTPTRPELAPAVEHPGRRSGPAPGRERARAAATRHAHHHGALPTVTELEALAQVSRGTAATVLKALRAEPPSLHLITSTSEPDDPTLDEASQS